MTRKRRLDLELVARGLAGSREEARRSILAGEVRVGDEPARKASQTVLPEDAIRVVPVRSRYASRGGVKLEGAVNALGVSPEDRVALDVGASTGGFTDCLLQHGAARVYAVDVGYGQLDWKLRNDPRVVVLERRNVRRLGTDDVPEPVDLVTIDVSFISLRLVLPVVRRFLGPSGQIVALVKPQFEVGRGKVGRGGVVREDALHEEAIESVRAVAAVLDLEETGRVESPLRGPRGNREFFLAWRIHNRS